MPRTNSSIRIAELQTGAVRGVPSNCCAKLPPGRYSIDQVGAAVVLADEVDLHNVGMVQPGDGLRLGLEPSRDGWIARGIILSAHPPGPGQAVGALYTTPMLPRPSSTSMANPGMDGPFGG